MESKKIICKCCGVEIDGTLTILDDLWLKINKGKMNGILCTRCMEEINKGKFKYQDLKKDSRSGGVIPGNLWYCKKNFSTDEEFIKDYLTSYNYPDPKFQEIFKACNKEG